LTSVQYGYDSKRRIKLEPKEKMKDRGLSSPDDADALTLRPTAERQATTMRTTIEDGLPLHVETRLSSRVNLQTTPAVEHEDQAADQ
jgi:hypothetical protein